jgi:hypothetical protein
VGDIVSQDCMGSNNYYTLPPTSSDKLGKITTETVLRNGDVIDGFDSNIWDFTKGELPTLKDLKWDSETSIEGVQKSLNPQLSIKTNEVTFDNIEINTQYRVYDVQGTEILSGKINTNESIRLTKGTYIIKLGNATYKVGL